MDRLKEILKLYPWGNTLVHYLFSIFILILGIIAIILIRKYVISQLKKWSERTETHLDDKFIAIFIKNGMALLYIGLLYIVYIQFKFPKVVHKIVTYIGMTLITFFAVRGGLQLLTTIAEYYITKTQKDESTIRGLKGIFVIVKIAIWLIALIFLLDNLGFKVSSVIAGFGIGGVAVALAAQSFLGDLFSYFSILFDKPFKIGDLIIVGDKMGIVEHIGIKTTRIRSISGEEIIFSNTSLTNSRIDNYKRMQERRIVFTIGVCYETPLEKLKIIPSLIKNIVESLPDVRFDRAHFKSFGDFNLIFEVVYYVLKPDYTLYMERQQEINYKIKELFEKEGINFAYPTSTVYLFNTKKEDSLND